MTDTAENQDYLDTPIWGCKAIAKSINRNERTTYDLLERGLLDADKLGGRYVTTRRRLRRQFAGDSTADQSSGEAA